MLEAQWKKHTFIFKQASGTSRGVLTQKDSWFISIWDSENPKIIGQGEASIIKSLSPDWSDTYEDKINEVCQNISYFTTNEGLDKLTTYPSIYTAIETALLDLKHGGRGTIFPSGFSEGKGEISINGLIWMGTPDFMLEQVKNKLKEGYSCIKLKIGAVDFEEELNILKYIRKQFSAKNIELRVDANGAFSPQNALQKLDALSQYDLHSIEQPIKAGQEEEMYQLCRKTPLPIALDEELIGKFDYESKKQTIEAIQPQYIILKPSLIGGFKGSDEWIELAEKNQIKWWITSALEGNIGLNAIAQYTFTKNNPMPQGLGTGMLYTNNTPSDLEIHNGHLLKSGKILGY